MRTTKHTIAVIVASTLAFGSVTTLVAADWPSFRGPNHDGRSAETISWPKDGPKQLWKINVGIGHSEGAGRSPTSLRCLDWKTGEIKWTEPKLEFNGLIAVGGKLLVLTEKGDLVLAEASPNGYKELGSAHVIETRAFTAPVFANGRVYVCNTVGDVVALDMTGK